MLCGTRGIFYYLTELRQQMIISNHLLSILDIDTLLHRLSNAAAVQVVMAALPGFLSNVTEWMPVGSRSSTTLSKYLIQFLVY